MGAEREQAHHRKQLLPIAWHRGTFAVKNAIDSSCDISKWQAGTLLEDRIAVGWTSSSQSRKSGSNSKCLRCLLLEKPTTNAFTSGILPESFSEGCSCSLLVLLLFSLHLL